MRYTKQIQIMQLALDFGYINKRNVLRILNIYKYGRCECELCHKQMRKFTIDHIVPKSKGGSDMLENLRLTHEKCNQFRGTNFKIKDLIRLLF